MKMLETQRLILREWHENDICDLFEIMKSPSVIDGGWKPHPDINFTNDVLNEYIKYNDRWAVECKNCKKVIACIRLHPDNNRGRYYAKTINYVLAENYRGHGYMTEAIRRVVKYAFEELNIDLLSAVHYPYNIKSKRILEKCGFEYEGTIIQGCKRCDGQVFDAVCYSILKTEYRQLLLCQ